MNNIFKKFLFSKHYFVSEQEAQSNQFEALFSLANLFGISIRNGKELATLEQVAFASAEIGTYVPDAFYRNFPQSVLELTTEQLLFDQLVHYAVTYGFGDFEYPGHSLFEKDFARVAFKEDTPVKVFDIVSEQEATKLILSAVDDMLSSSRPLSPTQYEVVLLSIRELDYTVTHCASKNTLVKLIVDTRNVEIARYLTLSDGLKVVEYLDYQTNREPNVKKLHFSNANKRFLMRMLDFMFENCHVNTLDCYERQAIWCGFLHHVHYKPQTEVATEFVKAMRTKGNKSVYSQVEKLLSCGDVEGATLRLKESKGANALLRNLNYLLSRCKTPKQVDFVVNNIDANNVLVLLQLLFSYSSYPQQKQPRTFKFVRYNTVVTHDETESETSRRQTHLSPQVAQKVAKVVQKLLKQKLKNKLGKVYVSQDARKKALPVQEGASLGGLGVMACGSKLQLPDFKKIRAFTYWEKVNDIDLSVIGLTKGGCFTEFSWRTMFMSQSNAIVYSGDQTSGYDGGSEYFDVNVSAFKAKYPEIRYLVFCNNVFSGVNYADILCRAGYMLRDEEDSGQVFEPKTVQSAYKVDCESTYAVMFGLDLETNEFVWINKAMQLPSRVAGDNTFGFLLEYFTRVEVLDLATFFQMMATKVVKAPDKADLIVSDNPDDEREGIPTIHSYDFEKITPFFE